MHWRAVFSYAQVTSTETWHGSAGTGLIQKKINPI